MQEEENVHYQAGSEFLPVIEEVTLASDCSIVIFLFLHGVSRQDLCVASSQSKPDVLHACVPSFAQVYRTLTAKMESIAGAKVEHNKYCLSVHFRCVQEEVSNDHAPTHHTKLLHQLAMHEQFGSPCKSATLIMWLSWLTTLLIYCFTLQ